ncbi:MAG: hypothetical protein C5B46_09290 [Proteobacteria bacterium]|nr:MAG: hypothetical protein C5B46_09290 [Pseudomonadota bacterium]
MAPPRITIIADDLTGAMDVAGPLADRGLNTCAVASIEGCNKESLAAADVVSINADTRHLPAHAAAARVADILGSLSDPGTEILIKKIDSTLRGNVVAETLAMLEASRRRLAVVAPAFPAQGRTVTGGIVHVRGTPLAETDFAKDALTPPPLDPLHILFTRAARDTRVSLVGCGEPIRTADSDARKVLAVDAETDDDLRALVHSLRKQLRAALLVGSAGIAQAVADVCFLRPASPPSHPVTDGTLLFVVGSRAQQSAQQVQLLVEQTHASVVPAPNGRAGVSAAAAAPSRILVLTATPDEHGDESDAVEVARQLAESTAALLDRRHIGALVVTGGDTAIAVLQRLGQPVLKVTGSLLPGIPFSRIQGAGKPIWFVTKAGGFGDPTTFVSIARELHSPM